MGVQDASIDVLNADRNDDVLDGDDPFVLINQLPMSIPSISCKYLARMLYLQINMFFSEKVLNSLHQLTIFVLVPQKEKLTQEIF